MSGLVTPEAPVLHTEVMRNCFVRDIREDGGKIYCGTLRESTDTKDCTVHCAKFTADGLDLTLNDGEFEKVAPLVDGCEAHPDVVAQRPLANTSWNNEEIRGEYAFVGDVEMKFTVSAPAGTDRSLQMIGLNSDPAANAGISVDHAIYVYKINNTRRFFVRENGAQPFSSPVPWANGDTFTIRRVGSVVTYLRNDVLFYTSTVPSTLPLCMDSTFYSTNTGPYSTGVSTFTEISACSI